MKSFRGLRGVTALEFAAGRTIVVSIDEGGLVYRADEYERDYGLRIDHWQAAA